MTSSLDVAALRAIAQPLSDMEVGMLRAYATGTIHSVDQSQLRPLVSRCLDENARLLGEVHRLTEALRDVAEACEGENLMIQGIALKALGVEHISDLRSGSGSPP